jgi:hypothetical protein
VANRHGAQLVGERVASSVSRLISRTATRILSAGIVQIFRARAKLMLGGATAKSRIARALADV